MSFGKRIERGLGALPGGRSLHRQLLAWLLLPQLVLWIAGAFVTYNVASTYANRAIDASLSQASRALARQVKPIGNGLFIDFPRAAQDILEADPSDRVLYTVSTPPGQFILGNRTLPAPPAIADPVLGEPYFYNGELQPNATPGRRGERLKVRVAAMYLSYGDEIGPSETMLVQVARSSANGEELARHILVDTLLPLSGLIVLMTVIVWAGIRAGLAPLDRLRRSVEGRDANDLTPIELDVAPQEVRALARAVNELLADAQRHVVAQKRFISDAAHQLRTPLAGLKSQTELALKDATDPALQSRLHRVHESATRSAHLVNQLLTLARAEPESANLQARRCVDLVKLARDTTAELVPRALQAGVDLGYGGVDESAEAGEAAASGAEGGEERTDGDGGAQADAAAATPTIEVRGTALLLREALVNLIDNAVRYAGRGASVTVKVEAQGGLALLSVEDTGPGVAEADRERVFERFVRATHEGQGCGLGLAIVKEIVERHAGRVHLEAVRPHGARVVLQLPLAAGDGALS